jgi:hypothetical protein
MFIENVGQYAEGARYHSRGDQGAIWLSEDAVWITLLATADSPFQPDGLPGDQTRITGSPQVPPTEIPFRGVNIRLSFAGANPSPSLQPLTLWRRQSPTSSATTSGNGIQMCRCGAACATLGCIQV